MPAAKQIHHIAWDMARCAKSKDGNVLQRLDEIAVAVMKDTGFFHAGKRLPRPGEVCRKDLLGALHYDSNRSVHGCNQSGVVRVNCVDCLDRTNTAEFMMGFCALRNQLHALGVIATTESREIPFDCDACRLLEEL